MAKQITCKYCGSVDKHHSFQCHTQRKPIGSVTNITKEWKAKNVVKKDKTVAELLKLAEIVFNKWIRDRDKNELFSNYFTCISCNVVKPIEDADCGHFLPKTYSALRFNEDNCHAECIYCNRSDPNHLIGYEDNLIIKIGLERFKSLQKIKNNKVKWDREQLLQIIENYKL